MPDGAVVGWDVGGVNTKVASVSGGRVLAARARPYELQRAPEALVPLLRELASDVHLSPDTAAHAVTMTAELSQFFRTKREGVAFVLDAITAAFPTAFVRVFTVDGRFADVHEARRTPLAVAAANWAATAHAVAERHPDAVLIDIGTTSTDIIPIAGGLVVSLGRTDPDRLASGELVYTGALRTPAEAIASHVPFGRGTAGVSAEGFALAGDVHVWRGSLSPDDYTAPTPDGRPATREFAGERLARVVCADREMLDDVAISAIADALAHAQTGRVAAAIRTVIARHSSLRTAVVTGLGAFIASAAARAAGLDIVPLAQEIGDAAARCAPAAAVALLLERMVTKPGRFNVPEMVIASGFSRTRAAVETVVKLGGGVLAHPEQYDAAVKIVEATARERAVLVVPGGGLFADAVREADRRFRPGDSAAHWMAVLAMDQHAHLIAARLNHGVVVTGAREAAAAIDSGSIPVLAPYRWLRDADPLPHSWDVTSDSIAAWVAGAVGAKRVLLIKPRGATGPALVDSHFARALPADVKAEIVTAGDLSIPAG
jgi:(4-(4-[2-(gamma-L-glutamylamino)ethyl]phenoxymethyl)furan-2-yl)methanamine synthase